MSGDGSKAEEAAIPVRLREAQNTHRRGRRIVASSLTGNDVDDGSQVGPLLDQVPGPIASFTSDGAYDRVGISTSETADTECAAVA